MTTIKSSRPRTATTSSPRASVATPNPPPVGPCSCDTRPKPNAYTAAPSRNSSASEPNATDAHAIGELVQKHKATLLLTTPTFCATYTRKCSAAEFASLRYVLVGAEKLRQPIADAFRQKFGVELLEGYGCTEMSPVVAVNAPNFSAGKDT